MRQGETRTLRVGISACLLGERVRYDGGHKRDPFLVDVLGAHVEWVPVCPEVELGLGVPRPPLHLARDGRTGTRLLVVKTREDLSARMRAHAAWRARTLTCLALDGYVLKSGSPSCGLSRVPVHDHRGDAVARGRGLFAEALAEAMPLVPMEDERRLARPAVREHFIERMAAAERWRLFLRRDPRAGDLQTFHARHKYLLLAHSPAHYAALGQLVASAGKRRLARVVEEYGAGFMAALAMPASRGRHVNVLEHMAGFFKRALAEPEREMLGALIRRYRRGRTRLEVPVALIREHARRLGVTYLEEQVYLAPRLSQRLSAASAASSPARTQSGIPTPR
jgi:uncharacterized protein YbbK (DUF523 family)/uncharacterized protein YbgA (DUF1722 family)